MASANGYLLFILALLGCFSVYTCSTEEDPEDTPQTQEAEDLYPLGSPSRCLTRAIKTGNKMELFEVLPGFGWDNLRNVDEGQVIAFNYSQCRVTDDGQYLLPDFISAVPVKTSQVRASEDFIEFSKKWKSSTAKSINIDASFGPLGINISGKFSSEFEDIKTKQIGEKSTTIRTQLKYVRYDVHLQPDAPLHLSFRQRVFDIAAAHQLNQQDRARYFSELLVRDFGTHVVTKADAGGTLLQMDQLQQDWVKDQTENKKEVLAAALSSFDISFNISRKHKDTNTLEDSYESKRTSTKVIARGGPVYLPSNFSSAIWAAGLNANLVAIDRSGDPLHYVITEKSFPELPASTLQQVIDSVRAAAETYYLFNQHSGCLDTKSPNFNPGANTDDGMCQPPATNLTFGGVFQTCTMSISGNGDLCSQLSQKNPLTGGYSCPSSYIAVELTSGSTTSSRREHKCTSFLIIFETCRDVHYESRADYKAYWCVATGTVPPDSGYLFGGLFTPRTYNPVTQAPSCPPAYFILRIGDQLDIRVCISDDSELGQDHSLPFGGFISCKAGNPLAVTNEPSSQTETGSKDLGAFFRDQPSKWPQRCPEGYSRHLAAIDQGCRINYCVAAGALSGPVLPPIKRPPFVPTPPLPPLPADNLVVFDPRSHTWLRGEAAQEQLDLLSAHNSSQLSSGAVAGTSLTAAPVVVALVIVAIVGKAVNP